MGGNITLNYAIRGPEGLSGVMVTGPWLKLAFEPEVKFQTSPTRPQSAAR
ncbi:MAG: hypothetical protein AABZ58_13880 [Chloroflexota bacterium]